MYQTAFGYEIAGNFSLCAGHSESLGKLTWTMLGMWETSGAALWKLIAMDSTAPGND